jgi:iron complex outermembrane receptor protein
MFGKISLMASTAVVALALPCLANAQTSGPAAASGDSPTVVGEVIVTAQRRQESALKVPGTIISNSAVQLKAAGVVETRDLNRVVPGFVMTSQNAWSSPSIRGVSSSIVAPGGEGPVAIYIDGIYEPSQQGAYADMPDVDHVEVDKGPQGTLFGRNATAGAIQIFTKGPSFAPHGDFTLDDSGWLGGAGPKGLNNVSLSGFLSGPIVADKLAGSISVAARNDVGTSINDANGSPYGAVRSQLYRGKLLFTPNAQLTVSAGAYYTKRYDEQVTNGAIIGNNALISGIPGVLAPNQDYHVAFNTTTPHLDYSEYGGYVKESWEVGLGTISNNSTYRDLTNNVHVDVAAAAALRTSTLGQACFNHLKCLDYEVVEPSESYSDELLFTSKPLGPISFVIGAFAYHENASGAYILNAYPGSAFGAGGYHYLYYSVNTTSYAGFGSVNYDVTSQLHLTVGARFTADTKAQPQNTFKASTTVSNVSPRASVRYDWTDHLNTYFTYSQTFRSGVYSSNFAGPPLAPEILTAYEGGVKYQSNNVRLNLSGFYYDYRDLQLSTFTGVLATLANANAELYGLDFDGEARLDGHFKVRGGGSYLPEAKYTTYTNAVAFIVDATHPVVPYNGVGASGCSPSPYCGIYQASVDASGARMIKAPVFTGFVALNYANSISAGRVNADLSAYYSSSVNYDVVGFVQQKAYITLDGDVSFSPASMAGVKLTVYAKNLNNAKWLNGFTISGSTIGRYFSPPPEAGIRVNYSF